MWATKLGILLYFLVRMKAKHEQRGSESSKEMTFLQNDRPKQAACAKSVSEVDVGQTLMLLEQAAYVLFFIVDVLSARIHYKKRTHQEVL